MKNSIWYVAVFACGIAGFLPFINRVVAEPVRGDFVRMVQISAGLFLMGSPSSVVPGCTRISPLLRAIPRSGSPWGPLLASWSPS